jgi:hypothetical protein
MKYRLVRGSEVQDFLRCRKRWEHKWVRHLVPKKQDGKLFFGNLFHKFLEIYHLSVNDPNVIRHPFLIGMEAMKEMFEKTDTSRMEQVDLDDTWNMVESVAKSYFEMWRHKDAKMRVIATEFTFAIPLANGIAYTGTIDVLYTDENGLLWFMDHKTGAVLSKYMDRIPMDRQISRYFWALQQLAAGNGYVLEKRQPNIVYYDQTYDNPADLEPIQEWIPVNDWIEYTFVDAMPQPHGFIYNLIKRDLPTQPKLLAKGGLSVDKKVDTTYAIYKQALLDNGLAVVVEDMLITDDKYQEVLDILKAQEDEYGNKFFKRVRVHREQIDIEASMQEFYATACDMMGVRRDLESGVCYMGTFYDPIYRNINDDCKWDCGTKGLCMATMDGSDGQSIVNIFYDVEEPGNEYIEIGGNEDAI